MSHLHVPDGILPAWLWGSGLLVALVLLTWTSRPPAPQRLAYRGALGGLMLGAMAVPLGPVEYHLTLAGPLGVLLGPTGALQVAFIVSAILALMGHGGVTAIGLNTLILGIAAAIAHPTYRWLASALKPPAAIAAATAAGQLVAGGMWFVLVTTALRRPPAGAHGHPHSAGMEWFAALAVPLWLIGLLVEAVVAFGIARFLVRVHPALLPPPFGGPHTAAPAGEPA
ncbi:MAG TPA: energy-coupling factor ABC transporter permease [Candidatus Limnocylindria bacterium]|nr:energy-coupling factor ABC transporter permease [Candidatus Limnocylindria bacterium]